ncbi:aspartate aminotransferase family protein [Kocuria massiliensis]|uniref:aspartate aminotransferase family protein n=1 Tax=Kocuria massiliensis TaxID=1926282 RepID=UPI001301F0CE|nr:aminotransferase class III-fold pyridoxal phosphate-dependent enzyme [Kocuria massiliensis]
MDPSGDLYERDESVLASPSKMRFYPLAARSGEGPYLMTDDGRRVLDATSGQGAFGLGYGDARLADSARSALMDGGGANVLAMTNSASVEFAQRLLDVIPGDAGRKVYLGLTGSDANTAVIRSARAATQRSKALSFGHSYHGGIGDSQAASGFNADAGGDMDPRAVVLPYPDLYRPEAVTGDPASTEEELLAEVMRRAEEALASGEIALVLVEPIAHDGGILIPPKHFLRDLHRACRRHGTLLCVDEVKVGLGRTGTFPAYTADDYFDHPDHTPDAVTLGKTLGGGLPVSAAIMAPKMADAATGGLLLTMNGYPAGSRTGLDVLRRIDDEGLPERAATQGQLLKDLLLERTAQMPHVGEVRGCGLSIGVELVLDRKTKEPATDLAAATVYRAFELGVALNYSGIGGNVLELVPPLTITRADAEFIADTISQALRDAEDGKIDPNNLRRFSGW